MKFVFLVGLCVMAAPVAAQTGFCDNAMTQFQINECTAQEMEAADAALNIAYKAAMVTMKEVDTYVPRAERGAAAALLRAQRAWITVRDETCTAQGYAMYGGSARQSLINGCLTMMTQSRTEELLRLRDGG